MPLQIQVLEYDPEKEALNMAQSYSHPQEVWQIALSPSDQPLLMTVHNEGTARQCRPFLNSFSYLFRH